MSNCSTNQTELQQKVNIKRFGDVPEKFEVSNIFGDAEWFSEIQNYLQYKGKKTRFLAKQFTLKDKEENKLNIYMLNKDFPSPSDDVMVSYAREKGNLVFLKADIEDLTLFHVSSELNLTYNPIVYFYFYYAQNDIYGGVTGKDCYRKLCEDKVLSKKRRTVGKFDIESLNTTIKLRDLCGMYGNASLEECFSMVGIDTGDKKLVSKAEKAHMNVVFHKNPNRAFTYSMGDSDLVPELVLRRVILINDTIVNTYGFDPKFTIENIPYTMGSLTDTTLRKYLVNSYPKLIALMERLAKVTDKDKQKLWRWVNRELGNQYSNLDLGLDLTYTDKKTGKQKGRRVEVEDLNKMFDVSGLARGSILSFASEEGLVPYNSLVSGGRCINEKPYHYKINNVIDPDLSSCYATTLRESSIILGIPQLIGNDIDDEPLALGDVLNTHLEKSFVDGCWQLIIDTIEPLSFTQNVLYSKTDITVKDIKDTVRKNKDDDTNEQDFELEKTKFTSTFLLARRELHNAVLTSDLYYYLKATLTDEQFKELKEKCIVVTGAYYDAKNELSPRGMEKELIERPGKYSFDKNIGVVDNRTRKWCRIPLEGFVGKSIDERTKYKKLAKEAYKKGEQEKGDYYNNLQKCLKLQNNTLYGVLCSIYFSTGNAIVANNITARARVGVLMMGTALGSVQSVTDGGMFSNDSVRFLKTHLKDFRKPMMGYLSDADKLDKHRSIKTGKLLENWEKLYTALKNGCKETVRFINEEVTIHVNTFWEPYGLQLPFKLECKAENMARIGVYTNASDYLLIEPVKPHRKAGEVEGVNKDYSIKVRGAREDLHPKKQYLLYLGGLASKPPAKFEYEEMIGLNSFLDNMGKKKAEWTEEFLPGESLLKETYLMPSNRFFPFETFEEFKKREDASRKARTRYKKKNPSEFDYFGILGALGEEFDEKTYLNWLKKKGTNKSSDSAKRKKKRGENLAEGKQFFEI